MLFPFVLIRTPGLSINLCTFFLPFGLTWLELNASNPHLCTGVGNMVPWFKKLMPTDDPAHSSTVKHCTGYLGTCILQSINTC